MLRAPSNLLACYFQRVASPMRFTRRVASTVQFTDISRNTLQTACHYVQYIDNNFNMLQVPCYLQLWASESCKIASSLQMSVSKCCKSHAVYKWQLENTANTMPSTKFCHYIVYRFLASERCKTTLRFSILRYGMTPNLANIMQFADVASYCCKVLCDGKVLRNELMLHNTMQCTGTSRKMVQIPSNFAQIPRSLEILTEGCLYAGMLLHAGAFTQRYFHKGLLLHTHTHLHSYRCFFCPELLLYTKPLRTGIFTQRCSDTQKPLYTDTRLLLHTDAST